MGGDRCLIEVWHFLSTEILTINSSDQVYNRKMLKYTLILYCSFCLSFGDKNWVTSLVLIKPIGKLSLLFFFWGGGGEGSVILTFRNTVYTAVQPKRLIWLERNNHRQRPLPTHQKKKKYIQVIDACFSAFLQYHRTLCLSCRNHFIICHRCYVLLLILFTFSKSRVRLDQYCFEVHCWTVFET